MPRKVQKSLLIRGSEYILTLKLHSHENESLTVEAMNKLTQITWRGVFNVQTVTRLSEAAGCAKGFSAVTAMLRAAILQTSRSVSLDLLKPEEIATMGKNAGLKTRASKSLDVETSLHSAQRVYLILKYQTEFEDGNIPLPLDQLLRSKSNIDFLTTSNSYIKKISNEEDQDFDDQRIAFVEYQIEVKHLRKENQKLREALSEERTNRKDFEEKFLHENNHCVGRMERQLSAERGKWKERTYQAAHQSDVLAKQLSLAKRELDSLRVQVRKLQAENTVYKRNLSASQRHTSPSPYAYTQRNPPRNSSIPSTYPHSTCRKQTESIKPTRYKSMDTLQNHSRTPPSIKERSRSYSPAYGMTKEVHRSYSYPKPAFTIAKTIRSSASHCSSGVPLDRKDTYDVTATKSRTRFEQEPRYGRGDEFSSPSSSVQSRRPASPTRNHRSRRTISPTNSVRQLYRKNSPSPSVRHESRRTRLTYASPTDYRKKMNSEEESRRKVDRSVSPAEVMVQKYRQGAKADSGSTIKEVDVEEASQRPPSLSAGDKFRDLLSRLQNLGEEFADSPAGSMFG